MQTKYTVLIMCCFCLLYAYKSTIIPPACPHSIYYHHNSLSPLAKQLIELYVTVYCAHTPWPTVNDLQKKLLAHYPCIAHADIQLEPTGTLFIDITPTRLWYTYNNHTAVSSDTTCIPLCLFNASTNKKIPHCSLACCIQDQLSKKEYQLLGAIVHTYAHEYTIEVKSSQEILLFSQKNKNLVVVLALQKWNCVNLIPYIAQAVTTCQHSNKNKNKRGAIHQCVVDARFKGQLVCYMAEGKHYEEGIGRQNNNVN